MIDESYLHSIWRMTKFDFLFLSNIIRRKELRHSLTLMIYIKAPTGYNDLKLFLRVGHLNMFPVGRSMILLRTAWETICLSESEKWRVVLAFPRENILKKRGKSWRPVQYECKEETVRIRRKVPRNETQREVCINTPVRRIENTSMLYTKVTRTHE